MRLWVWTKEFCNHFEQFEPLFLVVIFFMGSLYVHFCYESLVFHKGKRKNKVKGWPLKVSVNKKSIGQVPSGATSSLYDLDIRAS